jgi:truncated hemoglobin YjbI
LPDARRCQITDWLGLWRETVNELAPSEQVANFFTARADRISESLQMGIAMHRDGQAPGTPLRA